MTAQDYWEVDASGRIRDHDGVVGGLVARGEVPVDEDWVVARKRLGAAGQIYKRRGREPGADLPASLLGDHSAGEPRSLERGAELLRDRVQQRAVDGLVEHHPARPAELSAR